MKEYIGFCLFLTMMLKVPYPADITIHIVKPAILQDNSSDI